MSTRRTECVALIELRDSSGITVGFKCPFCGALFSASESDKAYKCMVEHTSLLTEEL